MQLYSSIAVPPYPPIMRMEVGEPGTTHDCLVRLRGDSFYDQPGDDYANISYNEPFAYSTSKPMVY